MANDFLKMLRFSVIETPKLIIKKIAIAAAAKSELPKVLKTEL
jgi:hypothetical protein